MMQRTRNCRLISDDHHGKLWECESPWDWAELLVKSLDGDERLLSVRMTADAFRDLPYSDQPRAVQEFVQRAITYERDRPPEDYPIKIPDDHPFERFCDPEMTLARGAGDCDDSARLVRAILRALGHPARLVFMGTPTEPQHVVTAIRTHTGWFWLDASLPARAGEHPTDARRRTSWETSR